MTTEKMIEQLRHYSTHPMTIQEDLMQQAADMLEQLTHQLEMARAERDANAKAYMNVAEELAALKKEVKNA